MNNNSDRSARRPLLTVDEAATYLAVRPSYIRRLINERRIASVKVGHLVRFDANDLDDFIDSGRRN